MCLFCNYPSLDGHSIRFLCVFFLNASYSYQHCAFFECSTTYTLIYILVCVEVCVYVKHIYRCISKKKTNTLESHSIMPCCVKMFTTFVSPVLKFMNILSRLVLCCFFFHSKNKMCSVIKHWTYYSHLASLQT